MNRDTNTGIRVPPWFMPAGQYFEQATAMPI